MWIVVIVVREMDERKFIKKKVDLDFHARQNYQKRASEILGG